MTPTGLHTKAVLGWERKNIGGGEPHPGQEPIWETLVSGRLIILGTNHSQRGDERILYPPIPSERRTARNCESGCMGWKRSRKCRRVPVRQGVSTFGWCI